MWSPLPSDNEKSEVGLDSLVGPFQLRVCMIKSEELHPPCRNQEGPAVCREAVA